MLLEQVSMTWPVFDYAYIPVETQAVTPGAET